MLDRQALSRAALVLVVALGSASPGLAAAASPFSDRALASLPARSDGAMELPLPRHFRALQVDIPSLRAILAKAPAERSGAAPAIFAIPYPDGTDKLFHVVESSIMEPGLQAKFPEIRTYLGQGIDDPTATARLSVTPLGFHAMVLSAAGTIYVDPYRRWDSRYVLSFYKKDARRAAGKPFHCDVHGDQLAVDLAEALPPVTSASSGTQLRAYRLALAATGEYSTAVCAPNPAAVPCALAAMVVSMNRVDGIYEREVAIRMVLIANDNLIVYTDGATDPYTNGDGNAMLGQNQANITSVIGSANYDIGHVFSTGGGGIAGLGVVCLSGNKARGVTGSPTPIGDGFDVDYVAHEMGHQFGANHTFNGTSGFCSGNRAASAAYEPGSGSTIMAYAGICDAEDLQPHSDDTFHTKSFDEIVAFSTGAGNSCAVTTATGNTLPTVNAGSDFAIPKLTPFTLSGGALDADGDALTYMWEEFDLGAAAPPNDDVAAIRPIFRSFVPLTVPSRTFPRLSDILNNTATFGESMPTRDRTMTFRFTVRDNRSGGGGVNYDSSTITVSAAAGPFTVTRPNAGFTWAGNSLQTVTWNVANTTAAPVNCAHVALALSTDGGNTFPTSLSGSTPNDGSETVTIPNTPTTLARIRVACVTSVFFDISDTNFEIIPPSASAPPTLTSVSPVSGPTSGGASVVLTGTGFVNGATARFGSTPASSVTFNSDTSLTAIAPAHSAGLVSVTVKNPDTQTDILPSAYTYDASGFWPLAPCRVVDTRNANGPTGGPVLSSGAVRSFPIAGNCGVPSSAFAVALNLTVISPTATGDLRVYPSGIPTPLIWSLSFRSGQTRANNGVIGVNGGTAGSVAVFTEMPGGGGTTHLVIDVTGYFR